MDEASDSNRDVHREFAVVLFNHVWELLEKNDRTRRRMTGGFTPPMPPGFTGARWGSR